MIKRQTREERIAEMGRLEVAARRMGPAEKDLEVVRKTAQGGGACYDDLLRFFVSNLSRGMPVAETVKV